MSNRGSNSDIPPPLELECLDVLWKLGEGNVHQVRELLLPKRELAYTTVMTLLDRLVKRGNVIRYKSGRSFTYKPGTTRQQIRQLAVSQLVARLFDGSPRKLSRFLEDSAGNSALPEGRSEAQHPASDTGQTAAPALDPSLL